MSVVAGCSLFNGVLLAADSRITFGLPNGRRQYADIAQKLFPIAPGTAIGFVSNDVRLASLMVRGLLEQTHSRKRNDPVSLALWMPRLLRAVRRWSERRTRTQAAYTAFLAASVIRSKPNVIRRADVAALMNRIAFGNPLIQRNWIPPILVQILETPPTVEYVVLRGSGQGVLYTMESPDFVPRFYEPLRFTAIGTGRSVVRELDKIHDWIFAGDVGNHVVEAASFSDVLQTFVRENGVDTVGGLCPLLRIDATLGGTMIRPFGGTYEVPVGGQRIQLAYENDRWIQRNATTGREVTLVMPWEVESFRNAGVFDDLDTAYQDMYGHGPE